MKKLLFTILAMVTFGALTMAQTLTIINDLENSPIDYSNFATINVLHFHTVVEKESSLPDSLGEFEPHTRSEIRTLSKNLLPGKELTWQLGECNITINIQRGEKTHSWNFHIRLKAHAKEVLKLSSLFKKGELMFPEGLYLEHNWVK